MSGVIRMQTTFRATSGVAADDVVSTMHFRWDGAESIVPEPMYQLAFDKIVSFWNTSPNASFPFSLSAHLGASLSRSIKPVTKGYQLGVVVENNVPVIRSTGPHFEQTWANFTAATGEELPREVACVMTYHADLTGVSETVSGGAPGPTGDTRPKARRRGRLYLGPLTSQASTGTTPSRPNSSFRSLVNLQATTLHLEIPAGSLDLLRWAVLSPSRSTDALEDPQADEVTGGWVDDAWDTQRRRGVDRTVRNHWGTGL